MKKILWLLPPLFSLLSTHAQTNPADILKKTVDKIYKLKSLGYDESSVEKNPFSSGDTSFFKTHAELTFDNDSRIETMSTLLASHDGKTKVHTIYLKDSLYSIDLKDSTYAIDPVVEKGNVSDDLIGLASFIKGSLIKTPGKIFNRADTIIDKVSCSGFLIKVYDTVAKGNHDYTYEYLYIDKKTLMPVFRRELGLGTAEKGGLVIGRLSFFTEQHFSGYRFNVEINPLDFQFDRSELSPANDKMLADGTIAPTLRLHDLAGNSVDPAKFKNKVILIEFGATACGANPLANPMLNRLNTKYLPTDFTIVSVYSEETADQVKKYIESNKLEFPVYMGSRKLRKAFKTLGTPNFYLIDKSGNVAKSVNGFDTDLENNLSAAIETYIRR